MRTPSYGHQTCSSSLDNAYRVSASCYQHRQLKVHAFSVPCTIPQPLAGMPKEIPRRHILDKPSGRVVYLSFFLGRSWLVWPHERLRQLVARGGRRAWGKLSAITAGTGQETRGDSRSTCGKSACRSCTWRRGSSAKAR